MPSEKTVRERLSGKLPAELEDIGIYLAPLLDEFEGQIKSLVEWYEIATSGECGAPFYKIPEQHPNREKYMEIMENIPKVGDEEYEAFLGEYFLNPVKGIACKIDETIAEPKDRAKAKRMTLCLPSFSIDSTHDMLSDPAFPYKFPHLYLEETARQMEDFNGTRLSDLKSYLETIRMNMGIGSSKFEIYYKGRVPGSYGTGKKR